ncbi:hypothetical protein PVL29_001943 [Vitis rotundifolia]|uniref:Geraniol 8-hydroxylase n=1 Tax=Vitis rotundifolia TaxID=103349 RepID=A0AA39AFK0_VITRO|nr:hypothetical protein PVL29_001943 [Vitis rotundifolia]
MELLSCLLCFLAAWTSIYILLSVRRGSKHTAYKLPPGPVPLPIIGNLLNLGNGPHESLANLAKTYGAIMTLKLGYVTTIVISSAPMAKEVLQKQDLSFCNRSIPDAIRAANHNQLSMAWIPVSTTWRALRRTCNSHLFTSQKLDSNTHLRHHKVQELLANVEQSCQAGCPVDIGREAFRTSLNLLSNTIFSVDLVDSISETAQEFKELMRGVMEEAGKPNLVDYFPVLRQIDPQGIRRRLTIYFGRMIEIFDRIIKKRLQLRKMQGSTASSDVFFSTSVKITAMRLKEVIWNICYWLVSSISIKIFFLLPCFIFLMNLVWFLMIQIAVGQINTIVRPINAPRDYVTGLICWRD